MVKGVGAVLVVLVVVARPVLFNNGVTAEVTRY
jgi:hypothetical protein